MTIAHVQDAHANSTVGVTSETVALSGVGSTNLLALVACNNTGAEIASVTDNRNGLWIQACSANASGTTDAEIWYASGVVGGSTTVTVTWKSSANQTSLQLSEWSGCQGVNAMDLETGNAGDSTAASLGVSLKGFENGELFLAVCNANGTGFSATPAGFTSLTTGKTGDSAVYLIDSGTSSHNPAWTINSTAIWLVLAVALLPYTGGPTLNQTVANMPQIHCEISLTNNPFATVFRNVARYLQKASITNGRDHGLDRFEAGEMTLTFDNRDGTFNNWNTGSSIWGGGNGMLPMVPVKITAAWQGITYPVAYGYLDEDLPVLIDAMNTTATVHTYDILEFLQNALLSNDNYAQLVIADGGSNLKAYYRLGDLTGQFACADASGNGATGSLIDGQAGSPAFGAAGTFLYDADAALDCTNGKNTPNGGFAMIDKSTEPPTAHNPLSSASSWSIEFWEKWTGQDPPGKIGTFTGDTHTSTLIDNISDTSQLLIGAAVYGAGIPLGTSIASITENSITITFAATATASSVTFSTMTVANGILARFTSGGHTYDLQAGFAVLSSALTSPIVFNTIWLVEDTGSSNGVATSTNVVDGNWHHVVVTSAGNAFIDGVEFINTIASLTDLTAISFGAPPQGSPGNTIAGQQNPSGAPFSGIIDDVAIYTAILTPTQVLNHYQTAQWFQDADIGMGSSGTASGRLNKVLAVAGFPTGLTANSQPFITPIYGENQPVTTTSALDYMQRISETEPGPVFQGPDGNIYGLSRQYIIGQGNTVGLMDPSNAAISQGIFGDEVTATYRFTPDSLQILRDKIDLYNDIQAQSGRPGDPAPILQEFGPTEDSRMAQSEVNFGRRVYQGLTQLLWLSDQDALYIAENYGIQYGSGSLQRVTFTILAQSDAGVGLPQILGRQIYDRITVQYQGLTPGSEFALDYLIEHIDHEITWDETGATWTWTPELSPFEIHYAAGISGNQLDVELVDPTVFGVFHFGDAGVGLFL